jgi:GMP synthase-like glutamine amidotransferase
MAPPILALQHISCEPPAAYEDELVARGLELTRVELDAGDALPDWQDFQAIVVMGGPMGAYDESEHPWLVAEKQLLREAVADDVPVWGVCLGAQLLASALGGRAYTGEQPEVGVLPVEVTAEAATDPVFAAAPASFRALQWHADTFELPESATLLASSPMYPNQAFRVGRSYGLQFHIEVSLALATDWADVPAYAESLESTLGAGALDRLLAEIAEHETTMVPLARALFGRWLDYAFDPNAADRLATSSSIASARSSGSML